MGTVRFAATLGISHGLEPAPGWPGSPGPRGNDVVPGETRTCPSRPEALPSQCFVDAPPCLARGPPGHRRRPGPPGGLGAPVRRARQVARAKHSPRYGGRARPDERLRHGQRVPDTGTGTRTGRLTPDPEVLELSGDAQPSAEALRRRPTDPQAFQTWPGGRTGDRARQTDSGNIRTAAPAQGPADELIERDRQARAPPYAGPKRFRR